MKSKWTVTVRAAVVALSFGAMSMMTGCGDDAPDCGGDYPKICGSTVCDELRTCCEDGTGDQGECEKANKGIEDTYKTPSVTGVPQATIDNICTLSKAAAGCS